MYLVEYNINLYHVYKNIEKIVIIVLIHLIGFKKVLYKDKFLYKKVLYKRAVCRS